MHGSHVSLLLILTASVLCEPETFLIDLQCPLTIHHSVSRTRN